MLISFCHSILYLNHRISNHQGSLSSSSLYTMLMYFWHSISCLTGLTIIGASLVAVPFVQTIYLLVVPLSILGLGYGMVDTSIFPVLCLLVNLRHDKAVYSYVFTIGEMCVQFANCVGPLLAIPLTKAGKIFLSLRLLYYSMIFFNCNIRWGHDAKTRRVS